MVVVRPVEVGIVTTGGTFDKYYDPIGERLDFDGTSAVDVILRSANIACARAFHIYQEDSRQVTDGQIARLVEVLLTNPLNRFVVVHGTSKMVEIALITKKKVRDKVVVFTGAMLPYRYSQTEASFNLGFALAWAIASPSGVWVSMNGRAMEPERCVKNEDSGIFEVVG